MRILGLNLDFPYLTAATLEIRGKKIVVCSLKPMIIPTADNVKQLYISQTPHTTSIATDALVRHLQFKISSAKQIQKILGFQVEALTSMSLQNIVYSPVLHLGKSDARATIFLTSKENLKKALKKSPIAPDRAVATFAALGKFAKHFLPELPSAFIIDLGSQKWTCAWIENHQVKKGFTIDQGIESILSALWEDVKKVLFQKELEGTCSQMDLLQLKQPVHPHLSQKLEEMRNALANVLYSFQKESGPHPIVFTGRVDAFVHLPEYLILDMPEVVLAPHALSLEEQKCGIAIGAAIEQETQFLTQEFTPRKTWQKVGAQCVLLLFASLGLSVSVLLGGQAKFRSEKQTIARSFKQLLDKTDKNLSQNLSLQNVEQGIEEAALAIQKYDKETPYILQAPNVTEVLSWLSSHPLLSALKETEDPIRIAHMQYKLVSFPHIDAMKDRYQAKVELEFSVKSPMSARKFHEALLQEEEFINKQEELTWESSANTYQTSFILKNKALNGH